MRTKLVLTFITLITTLGCTFWRFGFLPPYPAPNEKDADFGNAFFSYPTTFAENGAHTYDVSWVGLGLRGDTEPDAKPNDDVDGTFLWTRGNTAYMLIILCNRTRASQKALVNLLVDSDKNGKWDRLVEWVVQNKSIQIGAGQCTVVFARAQILPGEARFCIRAMVSDTVVPGGPNGWDGTGSWAKGEVEDRCVNPLTKIPTPTPNRPKRTPTPTPTQKWIETGKTRTPSPTPTQTPTMKWIVTGVTVIVCAGTRAYDAPNGKLLGIVKETRTAVELGQSTDGNWVQVQIHTSVGWIPASGLAVNGQCPERQHPSYPTATQPPTTNGK